ncbi:MAG: RagB/SusD family nutrient uptake outer membrane protein [Bacteroidota bacterium]
MKSIKLIIILISSAFIFGCDDLDVVDKSALPTDVALQDVQGYQTVLNSAYESVNDFGYYGQTMMIGPEILADNMELIQLTGRYELEYVNAVNSGINIWFNRYIAINECNIIIETIDDESVAGSVDEKARLRGEALFLRALFYHDLARVYGYEPGREVDNFNLAVPLVVTPTLGLTDIEDLPRASNVEVYTQIKADLNAAIGLLQDVTPGTTETRFASRNAARLLLARVHLYEGDDTQAAAFAQQVIIGDGSDLVQDSLNLNLYFDSFNDASLPFHPESLFESELQGPDWSGVDGANNSLHSLLMNDGGGSQFIISPSAELIAEIETESEDVRRDLFNVETLGLEYNKWRGASSVPFQENIPILRLSEAYLIAAEALGPGPGDAFLNALRLERGITTEVPATLDNVLREKRIEFMAEGHRWFDLKRNGFDIPKPAASGETSLLYTDFRILPRIPQSEINLSDQLVNNPGYN